MMDSMKERLIALLESAMDYSYILREMQRTTNAAEENQFGTMADFLLANGVVVREKGEWVVCGDGDDVPWMCSHCGKTTAHKYKVMYGNFCPNCGADMTEQNRNKRRENG